MEISLDHLQIWPNHNKQERIDTEGIDTIHTEWSILSPKVHFNNNKLFKILKHIVTDPENEHKLHHIKIVCHTSLLISCPGFLLL